MKKLKTLGLLSLMTINYLCADEYISDTYLEEIATQSEVMDASFESLPIAKTVEDLEREKQSAEDSPPIVSESPSQAVEKNETFETPSVKVEQTIQTNSYLEALAQAKREGKVIMLAIRATDCNYCDKMDSETLSQESVKEALAENFITIYYNQDLEPLPLGLQEGMTPNFIFVNTNEDIINQYPGMRSPKEFKEVLTEILKQ